LLLYYITDRAAFSADERTRRRRLLDKIAEAASCGVDYIQLREKDLPARELELLAREAKRLIDEAKMRDGEPKTVLLVNSRTDVALSAYAGGVHLPADDVTPEDVCAAWRQDFAGGSPTSADFVEAAPIIGASCHSLEEVARAAANRASFAVFGPVFGKKDTPQVKPAGLEELRRVCCAKIRVLALGGITLENARSCVQAGAAGVAAIRMFQANDIAGIVRELRG
jgi:thiamine-phosphate pyrophosphorylase